VPHVTLFAGADVEKSSVRVPTLADGEVDRTLEKGLMKALARFADARFPAVCGCSGDVEYGVCDVEVAYVGIVYVRTSGGVLSVEYGVTGSEGGASMPQGPLEEP
jgi:hypothetical protein